MIRGRVVHPNGRQILVIGLSGENVTRLAAGEPILQRLDQVGFPNTDIVVIYGKTEEVLMADFEKLRERKS